MALIPIMRTVIDLDTNQVISRCLTGEMVEVSQDRECRALFGYGFNEFVQMTYQHLEEKQRRETP